MILRLLLNLAVFLPLLPLRILGRLLSRRRRFFAYLKLRADLPIVARPRRFLDPRPERASLLEVLGGLEEVEKRRGARGVLVEILPVAFGWATAQALRARLGAIRASGKRVVAFLPQGGGTKEIHVASAADEVYLAPGAPVWAVGLRVESTYLGEAFERFGLSAQIEATGEHKSAGDRFTRKEMSPADRVQLDRILDVTFDRIVADVAASRKKTEAEIRAFFDAAPQGTGDAVQAGIVDGVLHEDEVRAKLDGSKSGPRLVPISALVHPRWPLLLPMRRPPCIAVVPVTGAIVPGGAVPSWASAPTSDAVVSALRSAARDRSVLGIVLAVDSPGGSATASEAIHREIVRAREKKPVVAVMGDVAASGGYYVSVAAERILVAPTTITGSIGVVGGKVVIGGLLERLGARREILTRGARASLLSPSRAWTDDERAAFRAQLFRTYAEFVGRVAEGRKKSREEVEALGGGRVWIGADAIERGLADEAGDLRDAIEWVRRRVGPRATGVRAVAYGGPAAPPPPLALAAWILATERLALFGALDVTIEG